MKKVLCLFFIALLFCMLLYPIRGFSKEVTNSRIIEAEGAGVIVNNDLALARDNAINDSLRKAVEQAVGTVLSLETIAENFEIISDKIYTKSQNYIQNYRILEEKAGENLCIVKIRATVSLGSIQNDLQALGFLAARKGLPRIIVLIAEQNVGQSHPYYYWGSVDHSICENVIQSDFLKDGFTFVDRSILSGEIKGIAMEGSGFSNSVAAHLGSEVDAELVIVGKVFATYAGNVAGTAMKSLQANVTARAIRTDTGIIIASASEYAEAVHIDEVNGGAEAIRRASEKLAESLKSQIINNWQANVSSTVMVALTVREIKSYSDFMKLRGTLKTKVKGIKNVYVRKAKSGVAVLDVEFAGSVTSLADRLAVKEFPGFSLDITNVDQNSLEMNIVK
jgi:hypothetical protein